MRRTRTLLHCVDSENKEAIINKADEIGALVNSYVDEATTVEYEAYGLNCYAWEADFNIAVRMGKLREVQTRPCRYTLKDLINTDLEILNQMFIRTIYFGMLDVNDAIEWYLGYYSGIISRNNISHVISKAAPHSFGDYVLIALAKLLDIPVYGCVPFFGWSEEHWALFSFRTFTFTRLKSSAFGSSIPKKASSAGTLHEGSAHDSPSFGYPYDFGLQKIISDGRKAFCSEYLRSLCSENQENVHSHIVNNIIARKKTVDRHSKGEIHGSYAILFLSYEPEASLTPMAGIFFNQLYFAKVCSAICSELCIELYVREHPDFLRVPFENPAAVGHYLLDRSRFARDVDFYKSLLSLPRVRGFNMMPLSKLLGCENLKLVFTISGSISLEAARASVPVVIGASSPLSMVDDSVYSLSDGGWSNSSIKKHTRRISKMLSRKDRNGWQGALDKVIDEFSISKGSYVDGYPIGQYAHCLGMP